ncbi:MAG: hypothetical protein ABIO49_03435 [Dokdonella sp.]
MARWIMLGLMIIGAALVFSTKSAGLLSLGLLCSVFGFFGFVFALVADRVSASARPETSMAAADDLAALRKRASSPRPRLPSAAAALDKPNADIVPTTPPRDVRSAGTADPSAQHQTS